METQRHFYPRSPCGERPRYTLAKMSGDMISIHALLAESDRRAHVAAEARSQFLSTLSLRRATEQLVGGVETLYISIHALLAESDLPC